MIKLLILIVMAGLFLEGCCVIGYSIGYRIDMETTSVNQIETFEEDDWLRVKLIDNVVLEGHFLSLVDDTLLVSCKGIRDMKPATNKHIYKRSKNMAIYQIPVNSIVDLKIRRGNNRWSGFATGLLADIFLAAYLYSEASNPDNYDF